MSEMLNPGSYTGFAKSGVVFVDCVRCGKRASIHVEHLDGVSDAEATRRFNERGWSVRPTLCPTCRAQAKAEHRVRDEDEEGGSDE